MGPKASSARASSSSPTSGGEPSPPLCKSAVFMEFLEEQSTRSFRILSLNPLLDLHPQDLKQHDGCKAGAILS